jgi:hypothetical protein
LGLYYQLCLLHLGLWGQLCLLDLLGQFHLLD